MHIPDGFIAPQVYAPAFVVCAGAWAVAIRKVRGELDEEAIPFIAVMTALAFVLMMVMLPMPGGTSVHMTGVGLLAVELGLWTTFLALSLVLLLQALLLGAGGITALPINALAMGFAGSLAALTVYRLLRGWQERFALFAAGWFSVVIPAILIAVVLGIQPSLASAPDGSPLFFPFGLEVTLPAIILPHLALGLGEGFLTMMAHGVLQRIRRRIQQ